MRTRIIIGAILGVLIYVFAFAENEVTFIGDNSLVN